MLPVCVYTCEGKTKSPGGVHRNGPKPFLCWATWHRYEPVSQCARCSMRQQATYGKRRCWRLEVERIKFTMFITVSMVFFRSPLSFAHSTAWWMMWGKNCVCGATAANLATSPLTLPVIAGAPSVTNKQTFCKSSSCSLKNVTIFWKSPSSSKRTPS